MLKQGLVLLSSADTDAPDLPAVATCSKDDQWDDGGRAIGAAAASEGALWCDRPYFTGNPGAAWLLGKIDQALNLGASSVQIGNELNLPLESWDGGRAAYDALYADLRAARPQATLLYQPPSPGVAGWQEWVAPDAPAYAVHAYGGYDQMRDVVQWYLTNTTGELWITELNPGAGTTFDLDAWAADDLVDFLDWCAEEPRVRTACYFAWAWNESITLPSSIDAKGTAVPDVLAAWTPPMNGGAGVNPWLEQTLTIWNLPDDPLEVITWAQRLRVACVELKTADGASSWLGPDRNVTPHYVAALRQGLPGVRLCGWSFNYADLRTGDDARTRTPAVRFGASLEPMRASRSFDRGDGIPEEEAKAAAEAVRVLGLDGHTFDLEGECEGHQDLVAILLAEARRLMPSTPFGAHTWACRSGHEEYPWAEIGAGVDVIRCMQYEPVWQAETMWSEQELGPWLAGKVVAPELGITESAATVPVLDDDVAVHDEHGAVGYGFWEYTGLPGQPGVADWISALSDESPVPVPDALAALQDRTWALCDQLQEAAGEWESLGWPSTGAGISAAAEAAKSLVRASKGEK